jgi:hypothetical protein
MEKLEEDREVVLGAFAPEEVRARKLPFTYDLWIVEAEDYGDLGTGQNEQLAWQDARAGMKCQFAIAKKYLAEAVLLLGESLTVQTMSSQTPYIEHTRKVNEFLVGKDKYLVKHNGG